MNMMKPPQSGQIFRMNKAHNWTFHLVLKIEPGAQIGKQIKNYRESLET